VKLEHVYDALAEMAVVSEYVTDPRLVCHFLDAPRPLLQLLLGVEVVVAVARAWVVPPHPCVPAVEPVVGNIRCHDVARAVAFAACTPTSGFTASHPLSMNRALQRLG